MKKEQNTIIEAINLFGSKIHHEVMDSDGISHNEGVCTIHEAKSDPSDGFSPFFTYGYRSRITLQNTIDPSYHICKDQTLAIEESVKYFENNYFVLLDESEREGATNFEDYYEIISYKSDKGFSEQMEDYLDSMDYFINEQKTNIVFDTWFYSKDNAINKSGKDLILLQVHVNPDDQIRYISPTGKDAFIKVFNAKNFVQNMQKDKENFLEKIAKRILKSIEGKPYVDKKIDFYIL
jgi:hypothetical protein